MSLRLGFYRVIADEGKVQINYHGQHGNREQIILLFQYKSTSRSKLKNKTGSEWIVSGVANQIAVFVIGQWQTSLKTFRKYSPVLR